MNWKTMMLALSFSAVSLVGFAQSKPMLWNGCTVRLHTPQITQGESGFLSIGINDSCALSSLKVDFLNQSLVRGMVAERAASAYYFLPVEYHTQPGNYMIHLEASGAADPRMDVPVKVKKGVYKQETLSVNPAFTQLPPETVLQVEREAKMMADLYAQYKPFDQRIRLLKTPLQSTITSRFGNQRLFNGEIKSYHNGVDFRAQTGVSVHAAADGRILFADHLFYAGNHVAIDHGAGIVTTYSHLSKIAVVPGAKIKQGELIGLTGSSGRVTGPHLHWVAKVDTVTVNPLQLQALMQSAISLP